MFTLFVRAVLLYAVMILVMRGLGKRQLGEFEPYELALTILLADIISGPIGSVSTPLLYGLIPVSAVFVLHGLLSLACMKSDKLRAIISGKPTVVVSKGVIRRRELEKLCLSLADLMEGLRAAGFLDPSEVGTAIIEANGSITAFADAASRPPQMRDLQLPAGYEGMPLHLIMDGRVQRHNLAASGKDAAWLDGLLRPRGLSVKGVYLATLDTQGRMTLQLHDGGVLRFQAMNAREVKW